jgi:UDP-N-acetylmuramate dehydrogenase
MSALVMTTAIPTNELRGTLRQDEPMARHTSWRAGGSAKVFYQPADIEDLIVFLRSLSANEPLYWVGLGSNLLVRDGGLNGTVIATSNNLNRLEFLDNHQVRAEVGVASPKLARETAKQGLSGLEFLCGIPGTVGGALALNAGALGSEMWQRVVSVETINRQGQLQHRTPADYQISYRHVEGPAEEWFVAATLQLEPGESSASLELIKGYLARRSATQPTQLPNAGSVFRNPPGDYAARLIETCGLKNTCVGGACVSEKHANFIINTGTATAGDIEALIERVANTVKREHGIALVREVHIVGGGRDD